MKYLSANFHNLVATPEGVATDVISRQHWTDKYKNKEKNFDDLILYKMESNFKTLSQSSPEKLGLSEEIFRQIIISQMGNIQTLLGLGIQYSANDWMKAIFEVKYDS